MQLIYIHEQRQLRKGACIPADTVSSNSSNIVTGLLQAIALWLMGNFCKTLCNTGVPEVLQSLAVTRVNTACKSLQRLRNDVDILLLYIWATV